MGRNGKTFMWTTAAVLAALVLDAKLQSNKFYKSLTS